MKFILVLVIIGFSYSIHECDAGAKEIVSAARSQFRVPYSWGGGNYHGKSKGIGKGAKTVGFDCSGLAQYAVYKGTGKKIARTAAAQYNDSKCSRVAYSAHKPGDLVFFGSPAYHVGIVSSANKMVHAPQTGDVVKEATIWSRGRQAYVKRCA